MEMSRLPTPVICVVIGEGGSGGALGIGVGDRVSMLEHAYYSVISPEGCAGILWKVANEQTKPTAAEALKLTAKHLRRLGVIDDVIPEPLGGAHRDPRDRQDVEDVSAAVPARTPRRPGRSTLGSAVSQISRDGHVRRTAGIRFREPNITGIIGPWPAALAPVTPDYQRPIMTLMFN